MRKKVIIGVILLCVVAGLWSWLLFFTTPQKVYEQEVRVAVGDRIVLGRVTDEMADLGTIKKGDKASFKIEINNGRKKPISIVAKADGDISPLVDFEYPEVIDARSSGTITVYVSGDTEGSYSGTITVERVK
jgi:hypothetical protein